MTTFGAEHLYIGRPENVEKKQVQSTVIFSKSNDCYAYQKYQSIFLLQLLC